MTPCISLAYSLLYSTPHFPRARRQAAAHTP